MSTRGSLLIERALVFCSDYVIILLTILLVATPVLYFHVVPQKLFCLQEMLN